MSNQEKPPGDRPRENKELYQTCPTCRGSGQVTPPGAKKSGQCQRCKGSGQVLK